MQIAITFTNNQKDIDLLIDNRQRIADTLKTLEEAGELLTGGIESVHYVKSMRNSKRLSVFCTYGEADIYSGDILEICDSYI